VSGTRAAFLPFKTPNRAPLAEKYPDLAVLSQPLASSLNATRIASARAEPFPDVEGSRSRATRNEASRALNEPCFATRRSERTR